MCRLQGCLHEEVLFTSVPFLKGIRTGVCTPQRLRQVKLLEEFDRGMGMCHTPATHSELLDADVTSLESYDLADSGLLASRQEEQDVAVEGEEMLMELFQLACPTYDELLEVIALTERFDLPWKHKTLQIAHGRLGE